MLYLLHKLADPLNQLCGCWKFVQVDSAGRAIIPAWRISHLSMQARTEYCNARYGYSRSQELRPGGKDKIAYTVPSPTQKRGLLRTEGVSASQLTPSSHSEASTNIDLMRICDSTQSCHP